MTETARKYLADILRAIDLVEEFTAGLKNFADYENDLKTQSATERQLAIIGEALNKLKKAEPELTIENDKQIISFRNRLFHAYDSIDNTIVWTIIKRYLPALKSEINRIN